MFQAVRKPEQEAKSHVAAAKKQAPTQKAKTPPLPHRPLISSMPAASLRPRTSVSAKGTLLQRKCASCEEEDKKELEPEAQTVERTLQRKLAVGASDDPLEREADRVADAVLGMHEPAAGAHVSNGVGDATPRASLVQRKCAACAREEEKEKKVQRFALWESSPALREAPAAVDEVLRGGNGSPLSPALRAYFEPRFGRDFGDVRVHTDSRAADSARAVNAHAYTVGQNIVFDAGRYAPGSIVGKRLIAHELAHVVQQSGTARPNVIQRKSAPVPILPDGEIGQTTLYELDLMDGTYQGSNKPKLVAKLPLHTKLRVEASVGPSYRVVLVEDVEWKGKLYRKDDTRGYVIEKRHLAPLNAVSNVPRQAQKPALDSAHAKSQKAAATPSFAPGRFVVATQRINMLSDLGGEAGARPVGAVEAGTLLKLIKEHPRGAGKAFFATVMKNPGEPDERRTGIVHLSWVRAATNAEFALPEPAPVVPSEEGELMTPAEPPEARSAAASVMKDWQALTDALNTLSASTVASGLYDVSIQGQKFTLNQEQRDRVVKLMRVVLKDMLSRASSDIDILTSTVSDQRRIEQEHLPFSWLAKLGTLHVEQNGLPALVKEPWAEIASELKRARTEISRAEEALKGGELPSLRTAANAIWKGENAVQSADFFWKTYFHETIEGGEAAITGLTYTRDLSFYTLTLLAVVASGGTATTVIAGYNLSAATVANVIAVGTPLYAEWATQVMKAVHGEEVDPYKISLDLLYAYLSAKLGMRAQGALLKKIAGDSALRSLTREYVSHIVSTVVVNRITAALHVAVTTVYEAYRGKSITLEQFANRVFAQLKDPVGLFVDISVAVLTQQVRGMSGVPTKPRPPSKESQGVVEEPAAPKASKAPVKATKKPAPPASKPRAALEAKEPTNEQPSSGPTKKGQVLETHESLEGYVEEPGRMPAKVMRTSHLGSPGDQLLFALVRVNAKHAISVMRRPDGSIWLRLCSLNCGHLTELIKLAKGHVDEPQHRKALEAHLDDAERIQGQLDIHPNDPVVLERLNGLADRFADTLAEIGDNRFFFGGKVDQPLLKALPGYDFTRMMPPEQAAAYIGGVGFSNIVRRLWQNNNRIMYLRSPEYNDVNQSVVLDSANSAVWIYGSRTQYPDPGHIMGTVYANSLRYHSSFAPANKEMAINDARFPRFQVGSGYAYPGAERAFGSSYTKGKYYRYREDPYVFEKSASVEADGRHVLSRDKRAQHFAYPFEIIDPKAFVSKVEEDMVRPVDDPKLVYQLTTVPKDPIKYAESRDAAGLPRRIPTPEEAAIWLKNMEKRGSCQAQNCVTSLIVMLEDMPMPGRPGETVLTPQDLINLGLDQYGNAIPGFDVRPQDLYEYLRWKEMRTKTAKTQRRNN